MSGQNQTKAMKTRMMDGGSTNGGGRVEGEETTNGGLTTGQMAGMEPLPDEEDSANIESNTLGGTSDSGAGLVGDGEPADTDA